MSEDRGRCDSVDSSVIFDASTVGSEIGMRNEVDEIGQKFWDDISSSFQKEMKDNVDGIRKAFEKREDILTDKYTKKKFFLIESF